jgi:hypothetical protein
MASGGGGALYTFTGNLVCMLYGLRKARGHVHNVEFVRAWLGLYLGPCCGQAPPYILQPGTMICLLGLYLETTTPPPVPCRTTVALSITSCRLNIIRGVSLVSMSSLFLSSKAALKILCSSRHRVSGH